MHRGAARCTRKSQRLGSSAARHAHPGARLLVGKELAHTDKRGRCPLSASRRLSACPEVCRGATRGRPRGVPEAEPEHPHCLSTHLAGSVLPLAHLREGETTKEGMRGIRGLCRGRFVNHGAVPAARRAVKAFEDTRPFKQRIGGRRRRLPTVRIPSDGRRRPQNKLTSEADFQFSPTVQRLDHAAAGKGVKRGESRMRGVRGWASFFGAFQRVAQASVAHQSGLT